MKKDTLIWKITNKLHDQGALDVNNYMNGIEQSNAIHDIIKRELANYILVKGEVLSDE